MWPELMLLQGKYVRGPQLGQWTKGEFSETPLLSVLSLLKLLGVSLEPHGSKTLGVDLLVASQSRYFVGRL